MGVVCDSREKDKANTVEVDDDDDDDDKEPQKPKKKKESFFQIYKFTGDIIDESPYLIFRRIRKGTSLFSVKIFAEDGTEQSEKMRKIFKNEMDFFKKMNHPNILRFLDKKMDNKSCYAIYEDIRGETLLNFINSRISSRKMIIEKEIQAIFHQILSAMSYIHSRGYVHRDLKPENFAFARASDILSLTLVSGLTVISKSGIANRKEMAGSYTYLAPEVIKGDIYDESSDVWSAGIILYILINGQHPFNDVSMVDKKQVKEFLMKKFKYQQSNLINFNRPQLKIIDEKGTALLKKMLDPNSKTRIPSASALSNFWTVEGFNKCKEEMLEKEAIRSDPLLVRKLECVVAAKQSGELKKEILKKIALPMISRSVKQEFTSLLSIMDENGNGFISHGEIKSLMGKDKQNPFDETYFEKRKMKRIELGLKEFLNGAALFELDKNINFLNDLFHKLDQNGSKRISLEEMYKALRGQAMTENAIEHFAVEMGVDLHLRMDEAKFSDFMSIEEQLRSDNESDDEFQFKKK